MLKFSIPEHVFSSKFIRFLRFSMLKSNSIWSRSQRMIHFDCPPVHHSPQKLVGNSGLIIYVVVCNLRK